MLHWKNSELLQKRPGCKWQLRIYCPPSALTFESVVVKRAFGPPRVLQPLLFFWLSLLPLLSLLHSTLSFRGQALSSSHFLSAELCWSIWKALVRKRNLFSMRCRKGPQPPPATPSAALLSNGPTPAITSFQSASSLQLGSRPPHSPCLHPILLPCSPASFMV